MNQSSLKVFLKHFATHTTHPLLKLKMLHFINNAQTYNAFAAILMVFLAVTGNIFCYSSHAHALYNDGKDHAPSC